MATPEQSTKQTPRRSSPLVPLILLVIVGFLIFSLLSNRTRPQSTLTPDVENIESEAKTGSEVQVDTEATALSTSPTLSTGSTSDSTGDSWTVFIYLCGTDLESNGGLATQNIQELLGAQQSSNVTYLIQSGGTRRWRNNVMSTRELGRWRVAQGGLVKEDALSLASMGDPDTLASFVSWGATAYPADKYMLIFWDHGGGSLAGVCADELYNRDVLTLPEIHSALSTAGVGFEVIGFDACLMATLENANVLSDFGHYLVASEESEPGAGWDYGTWGSWLAQNPTRGGDALGQIICDSYYQKCARSRLADSATLSVVDLTKIDPVVTAFSNAADGFIAAAADVKTLNAVVSGARRAERYGSSANVNMVDLGDLVKNTSPVLGNRATAVTQALNNAVVYEVHGKMRSEASGLSVYYPLAAEASGLDPVLEYGKISDNLAYMKYISVMNGTYNRYDWTAAEEAQAQQQQQQQPAQTETPVASDDINILAALDMDEDGYRTLTVTEGLDAVEHVHTWVMKEENGAYLMLGHDNDISSDGQGTYTENFTGWWMTIGGKWIYADLISEKKDEYNIYSIPAYVNGTRADLVAGFSFDSETYQVFGKANEDGDRIIQLEPGDQIDFLLSAIDPATKERSWVRSGSVTWADGMTIEETDLPDGTYHLMFEVGDVLGNKHYSETWVNTIKNGQVFSD